METQKKRLKICKSDNSPLPFSNEALEIVIDETAINEKVQKICEQVDKISGQDKINLLFKIIGFIDLTTLSGDDTPAKVEKLCEKAVHPVPTSLNKNKSTHTAAVCVYPSRIPDAIAALQKLSAANVSVASVAGGFPSGQYPLETRLREAEIVIEEGANEVDIVIDRSLVLTGQWEKLYQELRSFHKICGGNACLKTILSVSELSELENVYKASMIAMMAGTDFIKTSTGKEATNATLAHGVVMCQAIQDYCGQTNKKIGLKPAGGIKTAEDALRWVKLVETELGEEWVTKDLFRIGASSLLDDVVKKCT